jgi:hypothetical protein
LYDKRAVVGAVNEALSGIEMGARKQMPGDLKSALDVITKWKGYGVPFKEIQFAKKKANEIIRTPNVDKSAAIAITTKLDDLLTDTKNLSVKSPAGLDAPAAFDAARKATRNYKTLFENELTKPLAERTADGRYSVQPEQMLDRVFGGTQNALARFRELQRVPGLDITGPASDWVVSKVTKNGTAAITTPDDVARFMREPGNAALVNEIPGLKDRLDTIVRQSRTQQVQDSFANILQSNDMSRLGTYISTNRPVLNEVFASPSQRMFLDALERSANVLQKVPAGEVLDRKALDQLIKGNLFTILHGKVTGKLAEATAGAIAGKMIGAGAFPAASLELATAGGLSGAFLPKAQSYLSRLVYGTTQEQALAALNRAMQDPAYMRFLMQKPTIENQLSLFKTLPYRYMGSEVAPRAALGSRELLPAQTEETTEQAYDRLVREGKINPENVRTQRASGGRTGSGIAESLMRAAEKAKRELAQETEVLLNKPDEHIAKALEIAKQHI